MDFSSETIFVKSDEKHIRFPFSNESSGTVSAGEAFESCNCKFAFSFITFVDSFV